jgi:hypothetical protein
LENGDPAMTDAAVIHTDLADSSDAGRFLGRRISQEIDGTPDAVILFASTRHDFSALLRSLSDACSPVILVGGTSAGEFTRVVNGEGLACAVALRSREMRFSAGIGRGLRANRVKAAEDVISAFRGLRDENYAYRSAIVLTDATAGDADGLVSHLTLLTAGRYQICGGGVGGDERFSRTHVFYGTEAAPDALVGLEILSNKPIGIGAAHGWEPASDPLRVTAAEGMRLVSLNSVPAALAFRRFAERTGQRMDENAPLPFFLHNLIGVKTGNDHVLRVPLAVNADQSVSVATEVPAGAIVHFMKSSVDSAREAAARSAEYAVRQLGPHQARVALFFDCVGTRLRLGREFGFEVDSVISRIGQASLAGCNTIGQIVRAQGQFNGFHNCTAVACAIPE